MPLAQTIYERATAERMAAEMQGFDESGWTYTAEVVNVERGLAVIAVYDEEGLLAGYF